MPTQLIDEGSFTKVTKDRLNSQILQIQQGVPWYIASETGANNAIAGALNDWNGTAVVLVPGMYVAIKIAHTLQNGANTFALNGGAANAIKSHLNVGNNIGTAYAVGSIVEMIWDGTQWQDLAQ